MPQGNHAVRYTNLDSLGRKRLTPQTFQVLRLPVTRTSVIPFKSAINDRPCLRIMSTSVIVSEMIRKKDAQGRPAHWDDSSCSGFHNPWPSWRNNGFKDMFYVPSHLCQPLLVHSKDTLS